MSTNIDGQTEIGLAQMAIHGCMSMIRREMYEIAYSKAGVEQDKKCKMIDSSWDGWD